MFILLILLFVISDAESQVVALLEDANGTIWAASDGTLLRHNGTDFVIAPGWKTHGTIYALAEKEAGVIWVGTDQGLFQYEGKTTASSFSSNAVVSLYKDQSGTLWIGAASDTLARLQNGRIQTFALGSGYASNRVEAIHRDAHGNLLIGTRAAFGSFKDGRFTVLVRSMVNDIAEDAKGSLWLASGGDLLQWKDGRQTTYSLPPPPANVRMIPAIRRCLVRSKDDSVWIGTANGLFRLEKGSLKPQDVHGNVTALLEDRNGDLWIGTDDGKIVKK